LFRTPLAPQILKPQFAVHSFLPWFSPFPPFFARSMVGNSGICLGPHVFAFFPMELQLFWIFLLFLFPFFCVLLFLDYCSSPPTRTDVFYFFFPSHSQLFPFVNFKSFLFGKSDISWLFAVPTFSIPWVFVYNLSPGPLVLFSLSDLVPRPNPEGSCSMTPILLENILPFPPRPWTPRRCRWILAVIALGRPLSLTFLLMMFLQLNPNPQTILRPSTNLNFLLMRDPLIFLFWRRVLSFSQPVFVVHHLFPSPEFFFL